MAHFSIANFVPCSLFGLVAFGPPLPSLKVQSGTGMLELQLAELSQIISTLGSAFVDPVPANMSISSARAASDIMDNAASVATSVTFRRVLFIAASASVHLQKLLASAATARIATPWCTVTDALDTGSSTLAATSHSVLAHSEFPALVGSGFGCVTTTPPPPLADCRHARSLADDRSSSEVLT